MHGIRNITCFHFGQKRTAKLYGLHMALVVSLKEEKDTRFWFLKLWVMGYGAFHFVCKNIIFNMFQLFYF